MGFFSKEAQFKQEIKLQPLNTPQYMDGTFESYVKEAYMRNELIYSCVQELATSAPEAPLTVYSNQEDGQLAVASHPLQALLNTPNPYMSEFELWETTLQDLYLAGNAFWLKVRSKAGKVVELYRMMPDKVSIVPGETGLSIKNYGYEVNGIIQSVPTNDVVHFKFNNPLDPFFGLPPMRAAARATQSDNEATDYVTAILQNSATPSTVITTTESLTEPQSHRLITKWKQKFSGKHRGEPVVMQKGMDVKTLSMSLRDMEFPDLRTISESRICAAFRVPAILVGANVGLQRSTFSNYEEARRSFWQETIAPLQRRLKDRVQLSLVSEYKEPNLFVDFDLTHVSALQGDRNDRMTQAINAYSAGLLSKNEARAEIGLNPMDQTQEGGEDNE